MTQISKAKNERESGLRLAIAGVSLLTLAACASRPPPPNLALQAAEIAIANAEQARVLEHQSAKLDEARKKLTAARAAVEREQMALAQRLAEQARLDAELATGKAGIFQTKG